MKSLVCVWRLLWGLQSLRGPGWLGAPVWAVGSPVSYPADSFPGDSRGPEGAPPQPCPSNLKSSWLRSRPGTSFLGQGSRYWGWTRGRDLLTRLVGLGAGEWCSSVLCVQGAPARNFICIFPVSISCFMRQFSHAFISPIKLGVLIPLLLTKNESRI